MFWAFHVSQVPLMMVTQLISVFDQTSFSQPRLLSRHRDHLVLNFLVQLSECLFLLHQPIHNSTNFDLWASATGVKVLSYYLVLYQYTIRNRLILCFYAILFQLQPSPWLRSYTSLCPYRSSNPSMCSRLADSSTQWPLIVTAPNGMSHDFHRSTNLASTFHLFRFLPLLFSFLPRSTFQSIC